MSSIVKLYQATAIVPSRNMKIESIETYLGTPYKTITNFQYQKINMMEFDIKVDMSQEYNRIEDSYSINYASINNQTVNSTNRTYYYFVTEKKWRGESTLELHLVLDTVNTFNLGKTTITGDTGDVVLSERTEVLREHKDRFTKEISEKWGNIKWESVSGSISSASVSSTLVRVFFSVQMSDITIPQSDWIESKSTILVDYSGTLPSKTFNLQSSYLTRISFSETAINFEAGYHIPDIYAGGSFVVRNPVLSYSHAISYTLVRNIHLPSEGLSPVLYKTELGKIRQPIDTSWNLIYKSKYILSEEEDNPVSCYLVPDNKVSVALNSLSRALTLSMLGDYQTDNHILISDTTNVEPRPLETYYNERFTLNAYNDGINTMSYEVYSVILSDRTRFGSEVADFKKVYHGVAIHKSTDELNKLAIRYFRLEYFYNSDNELIGTNTVWNPIEHSCEKIEINPVSSYLYFGYFPSGTTAEEALNLYYYETFYVELSVYYHTDLKTLSEYDRTQSTLLKIIKIPYSPNDYNIDSNGIFIPPSEWSYVSDERLFNLGNLNDTFKTTIYTNIVNPIKTDMILVKNESLSVISPRNILNESKLYHSDYNQIKFIYDSFSYVIPLEQLDVQRTTFYSTFVVQFKMTSTINSKFAFLFDYIVYKNATQDYQNVLPVARNNEVVIYNSTYLNYLRTAFNYDLKAKERTVTGASISMGASAVGAITSLAVGIGTMNPVGIVAGVIGAGVSLSVGIINTVNTIASAEASIESKKTQLQNQSVSVAGSDDVDIMVAYTGNRAKLCRYSVSDRLKNALFDLFYLTGYTANERKIPDYASRYWFNFVAMNLDIEKNKSGLSQEMIDDLKQRYANGVTIFHYHSDTQAKWNIEQTFENWEVSLLS